jgi:hypothetical protein
MSGWGSQASGARRLPARLVAVDATCWFCRAPVRALAGVLVDPCLTADSTGFVGLADVAETVKLLDPAVLAAHNIGALRHGRARAFRAAISPTAARPATL